MRKPGDETSVNEYLTNYLKYFKTNLNSQLTVIQYLAPKQDTASIQQKLAKARQSAKSINKQIPQLQDPDSKINVKTLQRFCMRINEYLEYRILKTKSIAEKLLSDQIIEMSSAMHKVFSQVGRERLSDEPNYNITTFFAKIAEVQSKYMIRIARKINQLYNVTKTNQNLSQVVSLLQSIRIHRNFGSNSQVLPTQASILTSKRIELNLKSKFSDSHYAARIRSRKSTFQRIQSNIPFSSLITNPSPGSEISYKQRILNINSNILLKNPEQNLVEDIKNQQGKNAQNASTHASDNNLEYSKSFGFCVIKKIGDIFETSNDFRVKYTSQSLFKELMENNKQNQLIISKYRNKAIKQKKRIDKSPLKRQEQPDNENKTLEMDTRHKRAYTLDTSNSKHNLKKQQRLLELPLLKRKSIKI